MIVVTNPRLFSSCVIKLKGSTFEFDREMLSIFLAGRISPIFFHLGTTIAWNTEKHCA